MESLLETTTHYVVLFIEAVAVIVIVIGVLETLVAMVRAPWHQKPTPHREREIWLRFAHWLVAGLTLQLASDIVQTTLAPTWNEIGRLAAIAATRTFLSFFLDRDVETIREREHRWSERVKRATTS